MQTLLDPQFQTIRIVFPQWKPKCSPCGSTTRINPGCGSTTPQHPGLWPHKLLLKICKPDCGATRKTKKGCGSTTRIINLEESSYTLYQRGRPPRGNSRQFFPRFLVSHSNKNWTQRLPQRFFSYDICQMSQGKGVEHAEQSWTELNQWDMFHTSSKCWLREAAQYSALPFLMARPKALDLCHQTTSRKCTCSYVVWTLPWTLKHETPTMSGS